ncbi:Uu.00g083130.m01.CDS01 [Anthostomella pinea]|uniref:Uu.00g083130.m01.CDS01 n=1 Tax=Anthostomella pinea TaxID=933095 RepID=A0AAI8YJL6_9PEZI|nr:Uu.00g083130.m01.CDS01 [Anthostomella pinea]
MAEPTNTPMPTAPPTPRSTSPAPPLPLIGAGSTSNPPSLSSSPTTSFAKPSLPTGGALGTKPVVLHIGDAIRYNPDAYSAFTTAFEVIRPSAAERSRDAFMAALRERRWGDFSAIFRPFWGTGGEMGQWDAELIALLPPSVRVFASAGAGFDWADVKLLGETGIIYCNAGLAASEAVADFAVALIISTFRMLPYLITSATSAATFSAAHDSATAQSHNLRSHVLGLVGLGNIGQQIAHRCRAGFGMEVAYYDVERKPADVEARLQTRYCESLEALVRGADCVVLCTPSGAGRLINKESLAWFRPGARFVNIARGTLVDEEALADALEEGRVSNIALDVHANEPEVNARLKAFAGTRALLTCHSAGGTVETHIGFEELSMRNITAVLSGGEAVTSVNLEWLRKS